jgi:hypothetical protein
LSIGWKYNKRGKLDIDSYEADRASILRPREVPRVSAREKERLLKEIGGETDRSILSAQIKANSDQQQRWDTLDRLGGMKGSKTVGPRERVVVMKESLNRVCTGKSTAKEQRQLWENAQVAARLKLLMNQ